MDQVYSVCIPVKSKGRGVIVADHGHPGSFEVKDDLKRGDLANYIKNGVAVAFWLPKEAYACITVYRKKGPKKDPVFHFNYEVFGCNCLYKPKKDKENKKFNKLLAGDRTWFVFCDGQFIEKTCPADTFADCDDGEVVCV